MIDYVRIIGDHYLNTFVSCLGDPTNYLHVAFESGVPIPSETELIEKYAEEQRLTKIKELSLACERDIIGGFTSEALGDTYFYDAEHEDQINLLGATLSTAPIEELSLPSIQIPFACRYLNHSGTKQYIEHSYLQMRQVIRDGALYKLAALQRFHTLRVEVQGIVYQNYTQFHAALDAIQW